MKTLRDLDYSVLQQCMHCGLCLPSCPTYTATLNERHSPRGRIALMRAVADNELPLTREFGQEMEFCLGCLACTSACPANVDYAQLLETARADVEASEVLATGKRSFLRWFSMRVVFTRPRLLRFFGRLLWAWQNSGAERVARVSGLVRLLPASLQRLEPQAPRILGRFTNQRVAEISRPNTTVRKRVALLIGCVQDIAFSDVNEATVEVLVANGCEVHVPRGQGCCGSLHAHNGDPQSAQMLARRLLDLIDPLEFDAIISNAGGCGSHLRHYAELLKDDTVYAQRALHWSQRIKDIHEFLVEIGFRKPASVDVERKTVLTYHDSCHLRHGQKVITQPRAILRALPGFTFVESVESDWCCGSAGTYSITQPKMADALRDRKVGHLCATEARVVALANPGCHLQVLNGYRTANIPPPRIVHPIVLLAEAYRAEVQP